MGTIQPPPHPRGWDDPAAMIGVDEALARMLAEVSATNPRPVPLLDALGLVLADDLVSPATVPPFANSAMDGYAVRAADTAQAPLHRVVLTIVGECPAGYAPTCTVQAGGAARIMTGAPIPPGADAVVRFEETDERERALRSSAVEIRRAVRPGENVRPAGEDVRAGDVVLRRGARLRPAELSLLSALGATHARVHRRPRVAILATGDEVVDPAQPPGPGQIRNSNSMLVAATVLQCGGEPVPLGIARDRAGDLRERLHAAASADLIVTTGGVSVGDFDIVKDVLQREGRIALWQVRLRPGKPLAFGRIGQTPLLGLPGNPVAAGVAAELFLRPLLYRMLGRRDVAPRTVTARLLEPIENPGGRRNYVRVRVSTEQGERVARLAGFQGSGMLSSLVAANGLLIIPEDIARAEPGSRFALIPLADDLHPIGAGESFNTVLASVYES